MIQRIQTVYLVVGSVLLAASYLLGEIWTGPAALESGWFTPVTLGIYSLAIIGGLLSILLYQNLERQQQAIVVVSASTIFGVAVLYTGLLIGNCLPLISSGTASMQSWIVVLIPLGSLGCFFLARKGVVNDVKLLKSVDRLR